MFSFLFQHLISCLFHSFQFGVAICFYVEIGRWLGACTPTQIETGCHPKKLDSRHDAFRSSIILDKFPCRQYIFYVVYITWPWRWLFFFFFPRLRGRYFITETWFIGNKQGFHKGLSIALRAMAKNNWRRNSWSWGLSKLGPPK